MKWNHGSIIVLPCLHAWHVVLESNLDTPAFVADELYCVAFPAVNKTDDTGGGTREVIPNGADLSGACTFEG